MVIGGQLDVNWWSIGCKLVVNWILWEYRFLCLYIDGHPQAIVVLFPCSLAMQGFKKAIMGIICCLFFLLHGAYQEGGVLHIQVAAGDEPRMAGAEICCMAGEDVSCMAGDGDVLYSQRWLLTLILADGIQPYLRSHIYWPCKPSYIEWLSFSSITISTKGNGGGQGEVENI